MKDNKNTWEEQEEFTDLSKCLSNLNCKKKCFLVVVSSSFIYEQNQRKRPIMMMWSLEMSINT